MDDKEIPLEVEGITESIYAGFWPRLGSIWLDFLIVLPVSIIVLALNSLSKDMYFITFIPQLLFSIWYHVYLVEKNGGTPGKLILGIKIIKLNGQDVTRTEAILRYLIQFVIGFIAIGATLTSVMNADEEYYESLGWMQKQFYLATLSPGLFTIHRWASNIWIYSELIVLLTNERKRAIHDFIAGTVIVKTKYVDKIREEMNKE